MTEVIEDYQVWKAYPQYRWIMDKLGVSLRLGYHAGPAGIPVERTGWYIVRPVYNPYGMGIGASKKWFDSEKDYDDLACHLHVPPGYFWCEWFDGSHYSIDYKRVNNRWHAINASQGFHSSENNLTKFNCWRIIEPPMIELPDWIHDIDVKELNIEFKDVKITEIHLRSGNDIALESNIGDEYYPIWKGDNVEHLKHLEFVPNLFDEDEYDADGHLSNIRLGYYKKSINIYTKKEDQ